MKAKKTLSTILLVALVLLVLVLFVSLSDSRENRLLVKAKSRRYNALYNIATPEDNELMSVFGTINTAVAIPDYKAGSCGYQVELIQRFVNRFCNGNLVEDGCWGDLTEKAIDEYYTCASHYVAPVNNRFFSYKGNGYQVSDSQFKDILKTYQDYML